MKEAGVLPSVGSSKEGKNRDQLKEALIKKKDPVRTSNLEGKRGTRVDSIRDLKEGEGNWDDRSVWPTST